MELTLDLNRTYTYEDYLTWFDDVRRELIDGFIKFLPAPRAKHAVISYNISWNLGAILKKNPCNCQVFYAPFDVRLPKNGEKAYNKIDTVVQPDICVVCDLSKIDERGCVGAPDMIVEILSPSTAKKDITEKFALYERSGVKEYWIVHPDSKAVVVYLLQEDGKYNEGTVYEFGGSIPVHVFDDYPIDWNDIFQA
ncbi:MAG: Uma2 family endonuclease [Tannerella sp.]|nr:Uma2 family endonuclease [Tannerella sp.]